MKLLLKSGILFFLFMALPLLAIDQINFINRLADKKIATMEDGVTMFILALNKQPGGFNRNVNILTRLKVLKKGKVYKRSTPLYRGTLALMIARKLKLGDSLFFRILPIRRYAFRACVADGIMDFNGSEWDKLSGEELIEIMALVADGMED